MWVWTLGVEGPTLCKKHSEMHVDCISSAIWLRRSRQFEIILNAGHCGHTSELIRLTEIQEWIFLQNKGGGATSEDMDMGSTFTSNRAYIGKPTCALTAGEMCANNYTLETSATFLLL